MGSTIMFEAKPTQSPPLFPMASTPKEFGYLREDSLELQTLTEVRVSFRKIKSGLWTRERVLSRFTVEDCPIPRQFQERDLKIALGLLWGNHQNPF